MPIGVLFTFVGLRTLQPLWLLQRFFLVYSQDCLVLSSICVCFHVCCSKHSRKPDSANLTAAHRRALAFVGCCVRVLGRDILAGCRGSNPNHARTRPARRSASQLPLSWQFHRRLLSSAAQLCSVGKHAATPKRCCEKARRRRPNQRHAVHGGSSAAILWLGFHSCGIGNRTAQFLGLSHQSDTRR